MSQVRVANRQNQCPFCREMVNVAQPHAVCSVCLTRHHRECWQEHGSCAVFGCGSSTVLRASGESAPAIVRSRTAPVVPGRSAAVAVIVGVALLIAVGSGVFVVFLNRGDVHKVTQRPSSKSSRFDSVPFLPGLREHVPFSWDGKKTLYCRGSRVAKLQDRVLSPVGNVGIYASEHCTVELINVVITAPLTIYAVGDSKLTLTNVKLNATRHALFIYGNAKVTLKNVHAVAADGLYVYENARLVIDGGVIESTTQAITAYDNARVTFRNAPRVLGKILHWGAAVLEGKPLRK